MSGSGDRELIDAWEREYHCALRASQSGTDHVSSVPV